VACGLSVFSQFSPTNLWDTVGTVWSLPDSEREYFRTIDVQWIGQWAFLALVALPRINNLRAVNIVISSTPAASTDISFIINYLLMYFKFVQ
jgi:hypothetical protein